MYEPSEVASKYSHANDVYNSNSNEEACDNI